MFIKPDFLNQFMKNLQDNHSPPYSWWLYLAAMLIFNILIFAPPVLLANGYNDIAEPAYFAWSFTCHQLDSRSLCYFPNGKNIIDDCTAQDGNLYYDKNISPVRDGFVGYKLPVCSRDIAIYLFMLLGGFAWPLFFKPNSTKWLPLWILILALLPTAIDGFSQFLGMRESTNAIRLMTGAIMGFAMAFYIIPLLNDICIFAAKKAKAR